jgi:hypothetical protein
MENKNIGVTIFLPIFELKLENTFVRCEKYSSKLDVVSLAYSYICLFCAICYWAVDRPDRGSE